MLDLTSDPSVAANEMVIARDMADILHNAYPKHIWAVNVDRAGGVAHVRNLALSGQWGFVIKLPDVYSASEMKPFGSTRSCSGWFQRTRASNPTIAFVRMLTCGW